MESSMLFNKYFQTSFLFLLCCFSSDAMEIKGASPFFSMPDMTVAKISPDGKSIATIRYQEKKTTNYRY